VADEIRPYRGSVRALTWENFSGSSLPILCQTGA
jgi:hypothetical protein